MGNVKLFLHYNTNKVLRNLGLLPLFNSVEENVNLTVINGLIIGTINHDFFTVVEQMSDEDYDY